MIIRYQAGEEKRVADALSRFVYPTTEAWHTQFHGGASCCKEDPTFLQCASKEKESARMDEDDTDEQFGSKAAEFDPNAVVMPSVPPPLPPLCTSLRHMFVPAK